MQSVTLMASHRPSVFPSNGNAHFYRLDVCLADVLLQCMCLSVRQIWVKNREICQVVGPIKGRALLLTLRATQVLRGQKDSHTMIKTKQ